MDQALKCFEVHGRNTDTIGNACEIAGGNGKSKDPC